MRLLAREIIIVTLSELIYDVPVSLREPANYNFAHVIMSLRTAIPTLWTGKPTIAASSSWLSHRIKLKSVIGRSSMPSRDSGHSKEIDLQQQTELI